jgi:tRNA-modifying protein YgfZ
MSGLITLSHRALIALNGPDWAHFLNGQTTINIDQVLIDFKTSVHKPLYYGAFLTPQGKLSFDFFLYPLSEDSALIDVPLVLRDELITRLNMFKLRAKVQISKFEASVVCGFVPANGLWPDPRVDNLYRGYGLDGLDDPKAYIAFRLTEGLADPCFDFPKDYLYPIDINLDILGAIDFKKGCFVGQETTSRMKRRGIIKNRLIPISHEYPVFRFGSDVLLGELRAGEILASDQGRSLALMRLDRINGALTCDGHHINLTPPQSLLPHILPMN